MGRFLVLGAVALAVVGCNSEDSANLQRDAGKLGETVTKAAGNAELVIRVNAALAQTKGVEIDGLHIEAKKGDVTVGGHVHSAVEKALVLKTVNSIKGVDKVIDNLRIAKD